jgi:pimeloyl-ACP methyl ester carboxylesterase
VPQQLELPTLLLAAQFDPRTPASLALPAAKAFPHLHVLSLPITGHPVVEYDACASRAAGAFLNDGDTSLLAACTRP